VTDVAEAEAFDLSEFAGVDDHAAAGEEFVEVVEVEVRVRWVMEGGDDVALVGGVEVWDEAEGAHAIDKQLVISGVASRSRGNAAFIPEFLERLGEGEEGVRGRREAELACGFEAAPLLVEVEAECTAGIFGGFEGIAAGEGEAEAGDALDTFVRGGDEEMYMTGTEVDGDPAKAAHGIDDESAVESRRDFGEGLDWIENAGAGFAMDSGNMSERWVRFEHRADGGGIERFVFGPAKDFVRDVMAGGDLDDAFAVSAVGEGQ